MAWPKFHLGMVVASPGALRVLDESEESAFDFLYRHASGDWGGASTRRTSARTNFHSLRASACCPPTGSEATRSFGSSRKPIAR
jgi:hypothetical protein